MIPPSDPLVVGKATGALGLEVEEALRQGVGVIKSSIDGDREAEEDQRNEERGTMPKASLHLHRIPLCLSFFLFLFLFSWEEKVSFFK